MKRKNPLKRYLRIALWIGFVFLILLPSAILFLALEKAPAVLNVQTVNADRAVGTRQFVKRVIEDLRNESDKALTISASEDDLNGLFAFGHRSIDKINGKAIITTEGFQTLATIRLPHNFIGDYLNFKVHIASSTSGLHFDKASVGHFTFSDPTLRFFAILLLDLAVGADEGKALYEAVERVVLHDKRIDIHLKPIPNMNRHVLNMRDRLSLVRDEVALMGDPKKVRYYYTQLMKRSKNIPEGEAISLSYFIGDLFKIAEARGGDPVVENRAAILALGIYFGSWRVEQMVGAVRTDEMKKLGRNTQNVGLAGREDLRLHFIISAALEIASERGITHAIGEFKELLDAGDGGSGFSFVDLAADRAGVLFSEMATSPATAKRFQEQLAANAHEERFFPNIKNLPEGLTKKVFENYFGDVEGERYIRLVADVDACLLQLPVYRKDDGAPLSDKGCDVVYTVPSDLL